MKIVALVFLAPSISLACKLGHDSPWSWGKDELIEKTKVIALATLKDRAVQRSKEGMPEVVFTLEVEKVLKGKGNITSVKVKVPQGGESVRPAMYGTDCSLLVGFEKSKKYLIFEDSFNPKGYAEIVGPDDSWLKYVQDVLAKSGAAIATRATFCASLFGEKADLTFEPVESNYGVTVQHGLSGAKISRAKGLPLPTGFRCMIVESDKKKCPKGMKYNTKRTEGGSCLSKIFDLRELCPTELEEIWPELKSSVCKDKSEQTPAAQ